jgi:hypothetical protein
MPRRRATWELVGEILGALPATELDPPGGHHAQAWRVNGKVIVARNPLMRVPDEPSIRAGRGDLLMLWSDYDARETLMAESPDAFFVTPHYERPAWVLVWLDRVDAQQLSEVLTDAWRNRAPKRLVREFDAR